MPSKKKYEVELRLSVGRPMGGLKELSRSSPTLFMGDIGEKLHIVVAYFCFFPRSSLYLDLY